MEPNAGAELITLSSRPELRWRVRCLTDWATQVPHTLYVFEIFFNRNFFERLFLLILDVIQEKKETGQSETIPGRQCRKKEEKAAWSRGGSQRGAWKVGLGSPYVKELKQF